MQFKGLRSAISTKQNKILFCQRFGVAGTVTQYLFRKYQHLSHHVPVDLAKMQAVSEHVIEESLRQLVRTSHRLVVLTGAGLSTDSGIPDYRSPGRAAYKPITHQDFLRSEYTRKRYWARSMMGYPILSKSEPNPGHRAIASAPNVHSIITQNVDGLHQRAGNTA
eukprot:g36050.t1